VVSEEPQRIDVAEAISLAADAHMQSAVATTGAGRAQPAPAAHPGARPDGDRAQREVRHPPAAADDADRAAGIGHPAGERDPPRAGRANGLSGRGGEIHASVPAALEGIRAQIEAAHRLALHGLQPAGILAGH
jgi:hypothetical protein